MDELSMYLLRFAMLFNGAETSRMKDSAEKHAQASRFAAWRTCPILLSYGSAH